jgi:glucosamine-6-phosphate deaminase
MDVVIVEDQEALGRGAASFVVEELRTDPRLVLGVATGSSPVTTYHALAAARRDGLDFSQVRCVALDEYIGIPETDPASYHSFVRREIAVPLGIRPENLFVPDGNASDPAAAGAAFEETIRDLGGVAVQLLGIGRLSPTTRADNARFFRRPEDVPTHCLTQGLGTILDAARLLLVASGSHKAGAVAAAVEGPVTEDCPASVLQRHPHATVIVDRTAAARLRGSDRRHPSPDDDWLD